MLLTNFFSMFKKKYDPKATTIMAQLKGTETTITVSKTKGMLLYDIAITKNNCKDKNACKQDMLTLPLWKLHNLASWILKAEHQKDAWDELFNENTNGCWINCDCHREWLRAEIIDFDKDEESTAVYFTLYDIAGTKSIWKRKWSNQVEANYKDAKIFARKLLELKND